MIDLQAFEHIGKIDNKHKWGDQIRLINKPNYCFKILRLTEVNVKGSLHCHLKKHETWKLLEGVIKVKYYDSNIPNIIELYTGESFDIYRLCPHQFWAIEPAVILEVSTYDNDKDTYRYYKEHDWYINEDGLELPSCWLSIWHKHNSIIKTFQDTNIRGGAV